MPSPRETLLRGHDIVCISSIDWDFIWQGHQQIMSTLAEQGNRVLFIENTGVRPPTPRDLPRMKKRVLNWWRSTKGFRWERENLFLYSPLVLPFPYSRLARWLNRRIVVHSVRRWMQAVEFTRPIVVTFLPTALALDLVDALDAKLSVYYCIDDFAQSSLLARRIRRFEARMFRRVDLVFVTSHSLYDRARRYNPNVTFFPFGVDLEHFEKARSMSDSAPEDIRHLPHPIVGYVGGVHRWLDQRLLEAVAHRLPHVSFVFVGPLQIDVGRLSRLPNVHFLGPRSHADIPSYVLAFDVGIVPYVLHRYTEHVYPTKLNEYLAMGKPVVSTDLIEIRHFNAHHGGELVTIERTAEEFAAAVERAVQAPDRPAVTARLAAARENSWTNRIEQMSELIGRHLTAVERSSRGGWEKRLLGFYSRTGRRWLATAGSAALLAAVLLYTPLVWQMARPLAGADAPARADAIVVFAGGVGESGEAGQGYEERVARAVELYKAGYAGNMVFSSGYAYQFRETHMMQALAVSLGVPASDILLEERAGSTYENVLFVKRILDVRGWRSVLVVTSPYHVSRSSLVFRRVAPEIEARHTPIVSSSFYEYTYGAKLTQIRAIAHEYAAIAYYWWKGWI